MFKLKFYRALCACISASALLTTSVYSEGEGGPVSPVTVTENVAAIEDSAPYVKPGNVTVNFKNADIGAVLSYLSEVSGLDIVPSPDVTGVVTLNLTNKPWEVALDVIVKNYGYAYEREGDIIRVVTIESLKLEDLSTEVMPLNYANAENAQDAVKDMLTSRGKLTYDERINALIVTDLATNIYKIQKVMRDLDKKTPQIMIEAKIIETTLNDDEKLGIDWNLVIAASGAARPTLFPFANEKWREILPHALERFYPIGQTGTAAVSTTAGVGTTTTGTSDFPAEGTGGTSLFPFVGADAFGYGSLDFSQFSAVLRYLDSRSNTEIISNPRITTLNNKTAKMFVGQVYNYISEVEQEDDSAGADRWTYKIEKEEIGIRLLVTPHINAVGEIVVELKPEIKDVISFQQVTEFFSLPVFTTREAETQVMVEDGHTIFIGGLIRENIMDHEKKFPFLGDILGDIPVIGGLFKYESQISQKTELVFFLTVHVVKDAVTHNRLATSGMTELVIPPELIGGPPGLDHKPIFDFRKPAANEVMVPLQLIGENPEISRFRKKRKSLFDFPGKKQ